MPTENCKLLSELCADETVDSSIVSQWSQRFTEDCVSIEDDPDIRRPYIASFSLNSIFSKLSFFKVKL